MYANVVVLTHQPPQIKSYTYEIPKNLVSQVRIGQLVQVPFGKRTPLGVIIATRNQVPGTRDQEIQIKRISSIALLDPILLHYQIKLLEWLSFYYHAPMVNCLEAMLPPFSQSAKRLTINAKTSNQQPGTRNQILVLVPTINRVPETLAQFPMAKNYLLYHNQLKDSEKFENWLKIKSGTCDFIFGSRHAIFTPCPNLTRIVICDEHGGAYKDERSPYFDALTVAEKITQLTGANLEIVDSSPKVATYFTHQKELTIPKIKDGPKVKIVSMADERQAGNKSPISSTLSEGLKKVFKTKGRALLFLNKKAESGQIYCRACKQQNFAPKMPTTCPNCQSPDIFFHTLNIFSLKDDVKKIIPRSSVRFLMEGYQLQTSDLKLATIDIATSAIFYAQIFQKYDLVAHVLTDNVLNIVDFQTAEKAYSQISDLKNLTKDSGILILQTHNPENQLVADSAHGSFENFYQRSLEERKMLSFPPSAILVKLTIKGKKEDVILTKANDLVDKLNQKPATRNLQPVTVLGPYKPVFSQKVSSYNIILKRKLAGYNLAIREQAIKDLEPYLELVPSGWQITVEPASLN